MPPHGVNVTGDALESGIAFLEAHGGYPPEFRDTRLRAMELADNGP